MTEICCEIFKYKNEKKSVDIIDLQLGSSFKLDIVQKKGTSWAVTC